VVPVECQVLVECLELPVVGEHSPKDKRKEDEL
jgi:hypothetical protein